MNRKLIIGCLVFLVLAACKKDPDTVSKVVTISYPDITLIGSKFITIPVGGTFVDSGATFVDAYTKESGKLVADTGTGLVPVDPSTPGMYTITYTAKNQNTFSSTVARYVAVTNYPDTKSIAGKYTRTQNGASSTVTRMTRAMYAINDFGAANLGNIGYFAIIDTATMDFGEQYSETLGSVFDAQVNYLHMRPADTSFEYILFAAGYGTSVRTFKKQ